MLSRESVIERERGKGCDASCGRKDGERSEANLLHFSVLWFFLTGRQGLAQWLLARGFRATPPDSTGNGASADHQVGLCLEYGEPYYPPVDAQ